MNLRMIFNWAWVTALIPYYIIYSTKSGGFGQILTDLETYTLDKLKTKVGNLVMMGISLGILYAVGRSKLPMFAKLIIVLLMYFIFGYNLFKTIDDPQPLGRGAYGTTGAGSGYFGRTTQVV